MKLVFKNICVLEAFNTWLWLLGSLIEFMPCNAFSLTGGDR